MKNNTTYITAIAATLTMIGTCAHAEDQPKIKNIQPVISVTQAQTLVHIPLETQIKIDAKNTSDLRSEEQIDTDFTPLIEYDFIGGLDANIGVINTHDGERRFKDDSASLPRGRTFKPLDSKVGAGVSRNF